MTQTVGVVTRDFAKVHPETVRAIIAGRRDGVDFIRQHTDEAVAITAEMWHLDPALTRRLFNGMFEIGYWTDGSFDYAAMDHMVEGLQIVGKLKGPMDWSKVVDARYLPDDLQAKSH
jgi:NitT/TauT family transport system substrate-binding protein